MNTVSVAAVGPDIPHPLLAATGNYAGLLPWNIDRAFPQAAGWLESKFPLWAFSIVEDWATGAFDHLDAVVFSRGDDAAQRLYYYLCELRRRGAVQGPEPLILDVARIARAGAEQRCITAVRNLAGRLGVDEAAAEAAIVTANGRMAPAAAAPLQPACLLAGTLPPDRRLHDMVQAAGWHADGPTMGDVWGHLSTPVQEGTGDPFAALGRYLHHSTNGARSFHDRGAAIGNRARQSAAKAAVLWYAEEDEAEGWNLPAQRKVLEQAGVPTLVLTRRSWRADDGVAAEITTFLQEIA